MTKMLEAAIAEFLADISPVEREYMEESIAGLRRCAREIETFRKTLEEHRHPKVEKPERHRWLDVGISSWGTSIERMTNSTALSS